MSYTQSFIDRDAVVGEWCKASLELIREEIRRNNAELDEKLKNALAETVPESEQEKDKPCG